MGETVKFKRPDGKECAGYLAKPAKPAGAPALVVIQEWWGLNDQIRGVADRYAALGYQALVPDLYRGKVTLDAAEANHLMTSLDFGDAANQDVRGAVQFLKATSAKVGVTGFCMGGALTVLAAALIKEVDAASAWYGFPPEGACDVGGIRCPIQMHLAMKDEYFTPAAARATEAKMKAGGAPIEAFWYEAHHAFGNEGSANHDASATRLAWDRTVALFAKHLLGKGV